jgi:GEVED domain/Secretion system C-terminal sorting domain
MRKNYLFSILFFLLLGQQLSAQVSSYTFQSLSGTFTPLAAGQNCLAVDDEVFYTPGVGTASSAGTSGPGLTIPFVFKFRGIDCNAVGINTNGWINLKPVSAATLQVGSSISSNYTPLSSSDPAGLENVISAFGRDLGSTRSASTVKYGIEGTAPNRVYIVEWIEYKRYGTTSTLGPLDTMNFQIRLNETTNIIDMVYGRFITASATAVAGQVGLRGATNADYKNVSSTTTWNNPPAGATNSVTMSLSTTAFPANATIYRWTPSLNCTGTPVAGTSSAPATICPTFSFNLTNAGATVAPGITYQWQSSPAGANTFTDVAGATTVVYAVSQTVATDYRLKVTCTASSQIVYSNVVSVTMNTNLNQCYCVPVLTTGCTSDDRIDSVGFVTITNASGCSVNAYQDYTTTISTNVLAGTTYPIAVKVGPGGTEYAAVWIDYDKNGSFEASEFTAIGSGNGIIINGNISIPATALAGTTRMRVKIRYNTALAGSDACLGYAYGETEDYGIVIVAATNCTGTPVGGTSAGPTVACNNTNFTLTNTGATFGSGITYQWQRSPTGANTWTNIAGATNATSALVKQNAVTDYRLNVTCTNSSTTTSSNVVTVGVTTVGCPPANDSCQGAISLTPGLGICTAPLIGDLSLCDSTAGLALPTCQTTIYNNKDIWYKAVVPLSGKLVVQTSAVNTTTTDLAMQAYTGTCGALTPIAGTITTPSGNNIGCDDDGNTDPSPSAFHSRVVIDSLALAGQTVYFRVLPYSTASNAGQFAICAVQQIPLPLSSGIANACETSVPVNIDSARKYSTTPFVNAAGQIIGFIYPEGNKLGITTYSLYQNTAAFVRNTSNGEFYLDRNYNITVTTQPDVTVGRPLVTFYYTSVDSARFAIATGQPTLPGGLNITKNNDPCTGVYSGSGSFLAGLSGSGIALPNSIYFVQDTVSSFSSFYIHRGTAPLPISLLSFAGRKQDKTNMLEWSTASETNNKGFELQRSANGTDFTSIVFVNSKAIGGNSSAQLNYNFADVTPLAGTNYYRLKQVDKDGKFSMSHIVAIKGLKPTSLQLVNVYPNPTANKLNVNIESPVTENITLFVTDMAGKTLINLRKAVAVGDNNIELNVSALPTGSYLIKAICANGCETTTAKFVKQ